MVVPHFFYDILLPFPHLIRLWEESWKKPAAKDSPCSRNTSAGSGTWKAQTGTWKAQTKGEGKGGVQIMARHGQLP